MTEIGNIKLKETKELMNSTRNALSMALQADNADSAVNGFRTNIGKALKVWLTGDPNQDRVSALVEPIYGGILDSLRGMKEDPLNPTHFQKYAENVSNAYVPAAGYSKAIAFEQGLDISEKAKNDDLTMQVLKLLQK